MLDDHEQLAQDFIAALGGRPLATVADAARLVGAHPNTVRRALRRGELVGSRQSRNARSIRIRCRELARWVLDGERHSLPNT